MDALQQSPLAPLHIFLRNRTRRRRSLEATPQNGSRHLQTQHLLPYFASTHAQPVAETTRSHRPEQRHPSLNRFAQNIFSSGVNSGNRRYIVSETSLRPQHAKIFYPFRRDEIIPITRPRSQRHTPLALQPRVPLSPLSRARIGRNLRPEQ